MPRHHSVLAMAAPVVLAVLLSVLLVACADRGSESGAGTGGTSDTPGVEEVADDGRSSAARSLSGDPTGEWQPDEGGPSFAATVQPVVTEHCSGCHSPGGPGTAHWTLSTVGDIVDNRSGIVAAIETGFMPPWPAGGDSPAFHGDRRMPDEDIDAVVAWARAGSPIDIDPSTGIEPAGPIVGLSDPDLTVSPQQAYAGTGEAVDDYRCQIYDPGLDDGGWISAYEFLPERTEVVHHAIGYLIGPGRRAEALRRDGEDGRPGWECYGSSGLGQDDIFLGWAPGQGPTRLPDGVGLWVEPGAFIVVQIHYHYEDETGVPPDRSALALDVVDGAPPGSPDAPLDPIDVIQLAAPAEIPCSSDENGPLCDRDAARRDAVERFGAEGVLADQLLRQCGFTADDFAWMTDGTASSRCDIPVRAVGQPGELVSVLGHEHQIGSWFKMTLNPGQPDERVLLDIPNWDFDWQLTYEPIDRIILEEDDVVRIECGWDRSRRDEGVEPRYILWADGSEDEMCFATMTVRPPA